MNNPEIHLSAGTPIDDYIPTPKTDRLMLGAPAIMEDRFADLAALAYDLEKEVFFLKQVIRKLVK